MLTLDQYSVNKFGGDKKEIQFFVAIKSNDSKMLSDDRP
jgi:hypothetical protein